MKIVIFGYGIEGVRTYIELTSNDKYEVIGFADNSLYKQGYIVNELPILSINDLINLKKSVDFTVIIAAVRWYVIGEELERAGIPIYGICQDGKIVKYDRMTFGRLDLSKQIMLYAGDICDNVHLSNPNLYGLSINKADARHILHDITNKYPLPDNSISSYQAEDVLEHIELSRLTDSINEIYRILKKGCLLRICLPDYFSPYLSRISMKDKGGRIIFDPTGGGKYGENGVSDGGHVWFPNYKNVRILLSKTEFRDLNFLCYHTENGVLIRKKIDFTKGHINRIPKNNEQGNLVYSIVVDCYK